MSRYRLRITDDLCWGCKTCEVACKAENGAPTGIKLIAVGEEGPHVREGALRFKFVVERCLHCDEPPCADACPEAAITKRDDGIVVLDQDVCSGCRVCIDECPYDSITFDDDRAVAAKCNLCVHRVDRGLLPACADNVCLAHCIDLVDGGAAVQLEEAR